MVKELSLLIGKKVTGVRVRKNGAYELRFSRIKQRLILDARGWVFIGEEGESAIEDDRLCQKIRKEVVDRVLVSIEQIGFDRIIRFSFGERCIVVELFSGGNIILLDENGVILDLLRKREFKSRKVLPGEKYTPPQSVNPVEMDCEGFAVRIRGSTAEIISTLAVPLGMGADLAREVCLRAGIDEKLRGEEIPSDAIERIHKVFREILAASDTGHAYYDEDGFYPFLAQGLNAPVECESLNTCIAIFYRRLSQAEENRSDEQAKKERIIARQRAQIEEFERRVRACTLAAETIYTHFEELSRKIEAIRMEKGKTLPSGFERVKETTVKTIIDGVEVVLDWRKDIHANAASYYDEAKRFREKADGAREAMKTVLETLEKRKHVKPPVAKPKPLWFEKFRWFITSEGCLVIAGHNARENELLVRRHLKPRDIYIHADLPGAPSVILRGVHSDISLREGCAFAVCYSRAWGLGLASADAFWVNADQVSTHAPSGQFLARGSFLITGKKNFIRDIPLRLTLGSVEYEGEKRFVCGPGGKILQDEPHIVFSPGNMNREEFIKKAAGFLSTGIAVIERLIPPGNVAIIELRGKK